MNFRGSNGIQAALLAGAASMAIISPASAQERAVSFNIPSQDLASALRKFASASDIDLLYSPDLVANRRSKGVKGVLAPNVALKRLLAGTGITFVETAPNVVSLRASSAQTDRASKGGSGQGDKSAASSAPVSGTVADAATGAALPGVIVTVAGTDLRTVTDERGRFDFPAVRQGSRTLEFEYIGQSRQVVAASIEPGRRNIVNFNFGQGDNEILVLGYRGGVQKGLSQQKNADNSATIVSADNLGAFPAETVSEALRRVPGVAFGRDKDTGEGSRITVRGFSSEAINVQLNGLDLQGTGRSRTVDLSGFLGDNVSQITIHKTLLPSHEANGSGGLLEIETKSGLDYGNSQISLNLEREMTPASGFGNEFQAGAVLAKKLAPNLGVSATLQYRKTNRRSYNVNVVQTIPPVLPAGFTSINLVPFTTTYPFDPDLEQRLINAEEINFRQRKEESISGSFNLAWEVSDSTNLRLDYQRNINKSAGYFSGLNAGFVLGSTQLPIPELGGALRTRTYLNGFSPSITAGTFDQSTIYDLVGLRGDTKAGRFTFNYEAGYSRTKKRADDTRLSIRGLNVSGGSGLFAQFVDPATAIINNDDDLAMTPRLVGGGFVFGDNGVPLPSLSPTGSAYVLSDANYRVFWADRIEDRAPSYSLIGEFSTRYEPASNFLEYLQVGGKFTGHTQKSNGIESSLGNLAQRYQAGGPGGSLITPVNTLGAGLFAPENLTTIGLGGYALPVVDPAAGSEIFAALDGLLVDNPATPYNENRYTLTDYTTLTLGQNGTTNGVPIDTTEDKLAIYGEAKINLGKLSVVGGLRWEQEKRVATTLTSPLLALPGFVLVDQAALFDAGLVDFVSVGATNDTWTPSVLATWRPDDNIVARLGYFKTTVNPSYQATTGPSQWGANLAFPSREFVFYSVANPGLKPSTTDNFDVDLAYYFTDSPGLIRAGFFYKKVSNNFTNVLSNSLPADLRDDFIAYFAPLAATYPILANPPATTEFTLITPQNGEGGKIWGLEFEVNRKLNFLPGFLGDFGVIANATYTNAKFPTIVSARDATGARINLSLDRQLADQAEWVYNLALDYERDGFQGRVIYTHQDATADSFDAFNRNHITPAYSTLDAKFSYSFKQFGGLLTAFVEGNDLLRGGKKPIVNGAVSSEFGDGSTSFNYPDRFQFIGGRTVTFGIRSKF